MIREKDLQEYNKWLMEVWNPNQLHIPFSIDAPKAFLEHRSKVEKFSKSDVVKSVCEHPFNRLHWVDNIVFCNKCSKTLHK
jgi:hypothetical protein